MKVNKIQKTSISKNFTDPSTNNTRKGSTSIKTKKIQESNPKSSNVQSLGERKKTTSLTSQLMNNKTAKPNSRFPTSIPRVKLNIQKETNFSKERNRVIVTSGDADKNNRNCKYTNKIDTIYEENTKGIKSTKVYSIKTKYMKNLKVSGNPHKPIEKEIKIPTTSSKNSNNTRNTNYSSTFLNSHHFNSNTPTSKPFETYNYLKNIKSQVKSDFKPQENVFVNSIKKFGGLLGVEKVNEEHLMKDAKNARDLNVLNEILHSIEDQEESDIKINLYNKAYKYEMTDCNMLNENNNIKRNTFIGNCNVIYKERDSLNDDLFKVEEEIESLIKDKQQDSIVLIPKPDQRLNDSITRLNKNDCDHMIDQIENKSNNRIKKYNVLLDFIQCNLKEISELVNDNTNTWKNTIENKSNTKVKKKPKSKKAKHSCNTPKKLLKGQKIENFPHARNNPNSKNKRESPIKVKVKKNKRFYSSNDNFKLLERKVIKNNKVQNEIYKVPIEDKPYSDYDSNEKEEKQNKFSVASRSFIISSINNDDFYHRVFDNNVINKSFSDFSFCEFDEVDEKPNSKENLNKTISYFGAVSNDDEDTINELECTPEQFEDCKDQYMK